MNSWSDNPELLAATGGSSSTSSLQSLQSSGGGGDVHPIEIPDAPDAPDLSELQGLFGKVQGMLSPRKIGQAYDAEINTTRSQGFGAAANAGKSYAAREAQMGINPLAAGAVEAASRAPTYAATNSLTKDKEAAKLDAHKEAASIQTSIAAALGQIRESYIKTLADYNLGAAGLKEKGREFDLGLGQNQSQFQSSGQLDLAKILGSSGSGGSGFVEWLMGQLGINTGSPGYLPNAAPIDPSTGQPFSNSHNVNLGSGAGQGGISLRV